MAYMLLHLGYDNKLVLLATAVIRPQVFFVEPNMCKPPPQVLAVAIGNRPKIKVQTKQLQVIKLCNTSRTKTISIANGLESGCVAEFLIFVVLRVPLVF